MNGDGECFEHRGFGERKIFWEGIKDAGRDGDIFGESSSATIVLTRDAKNLAIITEIDFSATARRAFAAIDGGIKSDSIAQRELLDAITEGGDGAGGFVTHDNGRNAAAGRA